MKLVEAGQRDALFALELTCINGFDSLLQAARRSRMKAESQVRFTSRGRKFDRERKVASNSASEKLVDGPGGAFEGQVEHTCQEDGSCNIREYR